MADVVTRSGVSTASATRDSSWLSMASAAGVRILFVVSIPGGPKKPKLLIFFLGLCSDQQLSFFTLLDRASFPHCNNTKIIKFG